MYSKKKSLFWLLGLIAGWLFLAAFLVWFFDPFYQYHAPFFGMEAVFQDRDNQMPGSVRNLSYDSVLMGSSLAENFDSSFLDRQYGCHTLKIIRASGSAADLLYYLDMARESHELKNVFWCLDLSAMDASPEHTLFDETVPRYLHTETILDDGTYLWNKDILFQTIPLNLAYGQMGRNTGGHAYDWSQGKEFSARMAMLAYEKPRERVLTERDFTGQKENVLANLEQITIRIKDHPETMYRFFFPLYSMNWWDCAYVNGELEEKFYILEQTLPMLLSCDNVEVYYFQDEEEIICNLDNYMDMIHYSPTVSQYILDKMASGEGRSTRENWQEAVERMRDLAGRITDELIYRYYSR